ncbi:hypothetical protein DYI37_03970 [Fulvimarina endophytica]|uniref:AAA+ ATPase domain-containing protein n=1 Tax=Fulvimarina endophytica TaxID=2293836 RepID=A0A371X767_9HYPH|nr:AAA family ATPase [Fulvimarina endophytica]RFC65031.1 hypothetical protein DYI37_03970 [Fulvimarina endophytica]
MGITYRPAVRQGEKLMIGLAGPSGSGKTFSALKIATGIQEVEGGEIFVIDTENRRAAMYAGKFRFQHGEMHAPFTPEAYCEAIEAAVKAGAKSIVIDSMSHEHEGEGGILEMHEAALMKMAGNDFGKREKVKFTAWIEPKRRHNKFVNRLLQINAHIIMCFRAKDKLKMVKVQKGDRVVNEPVSAGWQPIAADRLEYEMTTLLVLPPNAKGKPDLSAEATKIPEPIQPIIKEGWQISEGLGVELAKWARGDNSNDNAAPGRVTNRTNGATSSQGAASGDGFSRPLREDPAHGAPPSPPPGGGASILHQFNTVLRSAADQDEIAARFEGFEDFGKLGEYERSIARNVYKLHLRRVSGDMSIETMDIAVRDVLEEAPA